MKKLAITICFLIFILVCLTGCSELKVQTSLPELNIDVENVESIDAVYGSVPVDAHKKHITKQEDIILIVDNLNSLVFKRSATTKDIPSGGIGTSYRINYKDGTSEVIFENHYVSGYQGELYVITEAEFSNLWEELDYEAVLVGEEGIPEF